MLLSNAQATGKTALLFEASARNDFASVCEIADSGEDLWEQALEIFVEARALADEYSAKIGAKPGWEAQIKQIVRRRAKNAKRRGQVLSPLDFSLADEFIRRNSEHIFREKRSDRVYLWDTGEREWVVDDRIKPFVVAFLKDCAGTNAAEQEMLLSSAKLSTVYAALRHSDALPNKDVEFDANKFLLGLPGAKVCDLRLRMSGIRDREPDDFITIRTKVFPEAGETPLWNTFLAETCKSDEELVAYTRRLHGYFATGLVSERKAYVLDGHGMNGKTTLCKVVRILFGEYGLVSLAKIVSATYDKHDTVFAALEKKRFVEIPEIDRSLVLGARLKELTGNDSISARGMREDERTIVLQCKLAICANNNIKFDATAKSNRQRIETIPFRNEVLKPDPNLADKLLAQGPAILADIIEQARRYLGGERLPACAAIAEATKSYADAADRYADFFDELYTTEPPVSGWTKEEEEYVRRAARVTSLHPDCPGTSLKDVYGKWEEWARGGGEYIGDDKLLATALRERGIIIKRRSRPRNFFCAGLRLVTSADEQRRAEAEAKAARDDAKAAGDDVAAAEYEKERARTAGLSGEAFEAKERERREAEVDHLLSNGEVF
jgi:putative DNA primase/helicase